MADAADSGAPPWLSTPTQHPPFEDLASMEEQPRKSSPDFFSRGVFVLLIVCGLCFIPAKPPTLVSLNVDARVWELLRLLFVGVVVSYGVLGRRNVVVVSHSGKPQKIASFDGEASFKSWNNRHDHSGATASVSEDDGVEISRQPSLPVRSLKGGNLEQKVVQSEFLDYSYGYSTVVGRGSIGGNQMVFDGGDSEKMRTYDSKSEEMRMRKEQPTAPFSQASPFLEVNSFAASLFSEEIYPSSSLAPENYGIRGDFLANKEKRSSHSPPSRIMLVENKNCQPQAVAKSSPSLIEEHMSKVDEQEKMEVKISEENIQNASDLLSESLGWEIRDEQYTEVPIKARSHRFSKDLINDFSMISKNYNQNNEEISKVSPMVRSDWEDEGFDSEILKSEARLPHRNKEAIVGKTKDLSSQPSMSDARGRHRNRSTDGKHSSADYVSFAKHPKEEASGGSTVEMSVRTISKKRVEDTVMDDGKKYKEQEAVMVKKREMKIDRIELQHSNKPERSSGKTHRSRSKKPMEEHGKEPITKSKHYDAASALASANDNKDSMEASSSKHAMNAGLEANEVDKKADEFIAKFRAQIRGQKAESVRKSNRRRMEKQLK